MKLLKTAVWAGLGLLFLTAIDSRAGMFTFDSNNTYWFDPGEFTVAGTGLPLYTITDGYLWNWFEPTNPNTGYKIAGVTNQVHVDPNTWAGATWTAPQGQFITSVTISGANYLGAYGNMGYGVFGGATTADTEYYRGQGTDGPYNSLYYYGPITINIAESAKVAVLQLRSFWNQSLTVTEDIGTYHDTNNNCVYITNVSIITIPEPATLGLAALGGLFALIRRKR